MSGYWSYTSSTTGGGGPSAPAAAAVGGNQIRIRAISASVGTSAGVLTIQDTVTPTANTYFTVSIPANGAFAQSDLDIRINVGQGAVIGVTNGSGINAQGDYVVMGEPYGLT